MIRKMYVVFDDKDQWLDIDSKEFGISYASNDNGYGLQCNYEEDKGGNDKFQYNAIRGIMSKMRELLIELIEVNALPFEQEEK